MIQSDGKVTTRQVTPDMAYVPERTYIAIGTTIYCHRVTKKLHEACEDRVEYDPAPLFQFDLPTIDDVELFMDDLFHGEYTGA